MRIVFSEDENEECSIGSNNRYIRGGAFTPAERCEYLDLWNQLSKKVPTTKTNKEIVARLVAFLVRDVKAAITAKDLDEATTASLLAEVDAIRTTFGEENTTIGSINAISLQYSILFTKLVMPIDEKDFNEITTFYKDITAYREKCVEFLEEVNSKYEPILEEIREKIDIFFETERDATEEGFLKSLTDITGKEFEEINRKRIEKFIEQIEISESGTLISKDDDFITELISYIEDEVYDLHKMEGYEEKYGYKVDLQQDEQRNKTTHGIEYIWIITPIYYQNLFLEIKRRYLKFTDITRFLVFPFDIYIDILSHGDDWKDYNKLMDMNIQYDGPHSTYGFNDFFRDDTGILAIDYLTIREILDSLLTYETPFFYCGLSYDFSITDGIPMNPFTFTYHDLNHVAEYTDFSKKYIDSSTVGEFIDKSVKPYYKYITSTEFEKDKDNSARKKIQYSNFMILFLCLHEHFIRTPHVYFKIFKKDVEKDTLLNTILAPGLFYSGEIFEAMIPPSYRTSEKTIQEYLTLCKTRFLDAQTAFFASTGGGKRRKTNKRKRKTARKRKTYRRSK